MRSCCPVTTPSHTVFPMKVWPGHKKEHLSVQINFISHARKSTSHYYFDSCPPPFFFPSFFFEFVIGEFKVKRVYIHVHGQTLDGILLILWCNHTVHLINCKSKMKWKIVIIQTFKCTCWQRIRQQKNQQRNFIFPNVIPHTDKSVLSFNSEGYDRDTHIKPQQCLLRIF